MPSKTRLFDFVGFKLLYFYVYSSRVIQSKNERYPLGTQLVGYFGWRTHTIVNPDNTTADMTGQLTVLPDIGDLSPSLGLGALGMPG